MLGKENGMKVFEAMTDEQAHALLNRLNYYAVKSDQAYEWADHSEYVRYEATIDGFKDALKLLGIQPVYSRQDERYNLVVECETN